VRLYSDIQTEELNTGSLPRPIPDALSTLAALCFGVVITLCVCGYQFGKSNHTIYLLDAFHRTHAPLLDNDWFTTQTFQYHAAFGWITRALMRLGIVEQGFLVGYLALVILFHIALLKTVTLFGGTRRTYLASVLFYYLSAGGTALGIYQFFQDSCFLASNIANVAMLWAFYFWMADRRVWSGICFGLAGLFHLNYALVGVGAWIALNAWDWITHLPQASPNIESLVIKLDPEQARKQRRADIRAWVAAIVPSMINIVMGAYLQLRRGGKLPLQTFVNIYVKFRHPHHYDPRSWPLALWICFIWSFPLAAMAWRILQQRMDLHPRKRARREAARIFLLMFGLQIVALIGAGLFYFNESLIQMSLYRFSIYCHLFGCIGAALLICDCTRLPGASIRGILVVLCAIIATTPLLMWIGPHIGWINIEGVRAFINAKRPALTLFFILSCAPAIHELISAMRSRAARNALNVATSVLFVSLIVIGWNKWIGLTFLMEKTDPDYVAIAEYAKDSTPIDAIFLVPPDESDFRLRAERAIVVNFKAVPQLGSELAEWAQRLRDILGVTNLQKQLPHGFDKIGPAMRVIYKERPGDALFAAARKYDARYVIATHHLEPQYDPQLIRTAGEKYFLYDLTR
jgi:hypothetical protein